MNKKRNPQDKAIIVMEFINTSISAAELCRKHNISPTTFQDWKDKFLQGGKEAILNKGSKTKNHAKEVENLKRIISEITVANDVLKKNFGGDKAMRMQAVRETSKEMSLNKALQYCGMSKHAWYYTKKPRDVLINAEVTDKVRKISSKWPTYGTRRMAAQVARETSILQIVKKYSAYIEK